VKSVWGSSISREFEAHRGELILDLRSEAYVALGPLPAGAGYFLRVVTTGVDGQQRALNHFNKKGKGELVRALALHGEDFADVDAVIDWGRASGHRLSLAAGGELVLEV
jgi:cytoplasmic iron level regulating protein YaaA (DUF328/UPF0246 family)